MGNVTGSPQDITMQTSENGQPLEDRALKMAVQFFGTELLPLLGVAGKVRRIAPTEQVHLEMKSFFEDFNFEMEDGTWHHFEFESDRITTRDLRRFRSYEALMGYQYDVEVVTCVVCTANVKAPKKILKQGINTFRVRIIRMKDKNADEMIARLEAKQKTHRLERKDLAGLLLTPLMSGSMSIMERIGKSVKLIQQEQDSLRKEDLLRMESVLYAFAMKFLSGSELSAIEEVFQMTVLGQMLEARGVEKGIRALILNNLEDGKNEVQILDNLEKYFSLSRVDAKQYYDRCVDTMAQSDN